MSKYELPSSFVKSFQSYIVWQTDIHTDRHRPKLYTTQLRAGDQKQQKINRCTRETYIIGLYAGVLTAVAKDEYRPINLLATKTKTTQVIERTTW